MGLLVLRSIVMSSRVSFDNSKKYMDNDSFSPDHTPKLAASPIDIPSSTSRRDAEGHRRKTRRRRDSEASSSLSSLSETFSTESPSPTTPPMEHSPSPEDDTPEVATSPILSYFMAHASPIKSARHFSFRDKSKLATSPGATSPLEDVEEGLPHVLHHARRMSHSWDQTKTIGIPQKLPPTDIQQERNSSIMRRLSISGSAPRPPTLSLAKSFESKPALSQAQGQAPTEKSTPALQPRRSATISAGTGPLRRPPSPMGERMLKGDFHGF